MLKITRNGFELPYKSFNFPAGEVGFKLGIKEHLAAYFAQTNFFALADHQTIIARIKNSNDVMELFMAVDALRRIDDTPINLFMPKLPYAQQDRLCDLGESFSLQVFVNLINNLNLNKVIIVDPHSFVSEAAFHPYKLKVITQLDLINRWPEFIKVLLSSVLVSPDSGALKKTAEIGKFLGLKEFVRADKLRDLSTGEIIDTVVYTEDLKGRDCVIVDDICLGGRTFIEIAKALRAKNCGKVILFVSHGVFNNGVTVLENQGIDEIWTTDSFGSFPMENRLNVLNLEEKFGDII